MQEMVVPTVLLLETQQQVPVDWPIQAVAVVVVLVTKGLTLLLVAMVVQVLLS